MTLAFSMMLLPSLYFSLSSRACSCVPAGNMTHRPEILSSERTASSLCWRSRLGLRALCANVHDLAQVRVM